MSQYGKNVFMQKQLPPAFSNSEVSTIIGRETFLLRIASNGRRHVRRDVAAVDYDAVAHEAMGLVGGEQVDPLPELVERASASAEYAPGKIRAASLLRGQRQVSRW